MLRWAALLGLAGLAAATAVIVWSGWHEVAAALAQAGWGLLGIAAFHLVPLLAASYGWQLLVPSKRAASLLKFTYFMWVRAAVNNLMPVARIGGEIAAIRLMTADGMRQSTAIAITVVELTLSIVAIFAFVVLGVILFALRVNDSNMTAQLAWGIVFSLPMVAGLIAVQKIGFFGLLSKLFKAMFRDKWAKILGGSHAAERLDRSVAMVYRRRSRAVACTFFQLLSWTLGAVELQLALYFLGHPLTLMEVFMLEALIQGAASLAFAIPGALGVQEAGFLLFGGMLGLPHEIAAALAVTRRCRDLICYVPGLVAWQAHEGKRLFAK